MAFVANELGLDFLLGAFTAGVLYRIFLLADADAREREVVESKLSALESVTAFIGVPLTDMESSVQLTA